MGEPATLLAAMTRPYTSSPMIRRALEQARAVNRRKSDLKGTAQSGDATSNIVSEANGLVEHLGDELPDAIGYTSADDQQSAEHQLLAETNARPTAPTTQRIRKEGKLRKVGHIGLGASSQRRLGKTTKARPDQYDLGGSPQKPRHAPTGLLDGPPQPSPLKKQRKAQQAEQARALAATTTLNDATSTLQVPPSDLVETEGAAIPRRSPRKSKGSERGQSPQVMVKQGHLDAHDILPDATQVHAGESGRTEPNEDEPAQSSPQKRSHGRPRKHREEAAGCIEARGTALGPQEQQPVSPTPAGQRSSGTKRDSAGAHEVQSAIPEEVPTKSHAEQPPPVGELDPEEDQEPVGTDEPRNEPGPPRIDRVRTTGLLPENTPDNIVEDTELDARPTQQAQKRKRLPEQANTSTKRQQKERRFTSQADVPQTTDASIGELEANQDDENDQRLLGQWQALNRIFRSVKKVGVTVKDGEEQDPVRLDLKAQDVIEIKRLCSKAKDVLLRFRDEPGSRNDLPDPPEELDEIRARIRGLCGKNGDYPPNFSSRRKPLDIYFHLIPRILVRLLRTMVQVYYDTDKRTGDAASDLTEAHLTTIADFIGVIRLMGAGAELYTARPDTELALVKSVKNGLLVPLRNVRSVFKEHLAKCGRARQAEARRLEREQEDARQEQREQQDKRHKAERAKLLKKWMSLHDHRRFVERGLISREKQKHLRFPDPAEAELEYDATGGHFQRQTVFPARIGPPPAAAAKARAAIWPLKAIEALSHGLERHAGPLVYENIFSEHCRDARGMLNQYNVTEIVIAAADLKPLLEQFDMNELGYVREWIDSIPVWPKVYQYVDEEDGMEDEAVENHVDGTGEG